jgi:hypothetical protein
MRRDGCRMCFNNGRWGVPLLHGRGCYTILFGVKGMNAERRTKKVLYDKIPYLRISNNF